MHTYTYIYIYMKEKTFWGLTSGAGLPPETTHTRVKFCAW